MPRGRASANILRQQSSLNRTTAKTRPNILSRSSKLQSMIDNTVIKMEPSNECETVVVDSYLDHMYTPHGPSSDSSGYNSSRSGFMLDKTPQVSRSYSSLHEPASSLYAQGFHRSLSCWIYLRIGEKKARVGAFDTHIWMWVTHSDDDSLYW